jgi:hypothetical protein
MSYIRTKKISDKHYAYLVENVSTSKGPRQKVKQYLGKVHNLEKKKDVYITDENVLNNMILTELTSRGFNKNKEGKYNQGNIVFCPETLTITKKTKSKTVKEAIIAVNEGYLCSFTLQRIINFEKSKDFHQDAYQLAKYFLEAGLQVSKEDFVKFYSGL